MFHVEHLKSVAGKGLRARKKMKKLFCICAALYTCFTRNAQIKPQTFDFWPQGKMPGTVANAPEKSEYSKDWQFTIVSNVSKPTLEVFRAKTKGPTGFVLICPGGSYEILAYDLEDTEIAEALNKFGVSAGVLKYRVPDAPPTAPLQSRRPRIRAAESPRQARRKMD